MRCLARQGVQWRLETLSQVRRLTLALDVGEVKALGLPDHVVEQRNHLDDGFAQRPQTIGSSI